MEIRTKLIALLLVISLVPSGVVGVAGLQNMQDIGSYAQERSTEHLERQITSELNTTVHSRQEEFQNLLDVRRVDARSLADSTPVQNYQAASSGKMELIREQSQNQLGYTALQMHSTVESTKRTILDEQYDGRSWDQLSAAEQRQVKRQVERTLFGTTGDGVSSEGTLSEMFHPGYIGGSGYVYVTDLDSNVVAHHSLDDGYNLREDASLTAFDDVRSTVESDPAVRNGSTWAVAEYDWEDTTQEGNPVEEKFIAYTYHEQFDWVLAPNVYYYELQTDAVRNARQGIKDSFRSYIQSRTVTVDGQERPAYDLILLTDASGDGVVEARRSADGTVETETVTDMSYGDTDWYSKTKSLAKGEVHISDVMTVDGKQVVYISTPVYYDGEFAGTIAMQFDYGIISDLATGITVGDSGHLSIVNEDGTVLSHPDESVVDSGASIANESYGGTLAGIAQNRILAGETGMDTYTRTEDGNETGYYVAYAPLQFGNKQFALLATVPESDVTAPSDQLAAALADRTTSARNLLLALFGGVLVAVVALGYKAAAYFSEPIVAVRDRATALAEGRFDETVEVSTGDDELGELVAAFDDMQSNLRRQVAELRSVSEDLGDGNLDREIRTDFPGEFGAIMTDLDGGVDRLQAGFDEIRRASAGVREGELDQEIDTDLPGEYGAVLADLDAGIDQLDASFDRIRQASRDLRDGKLDRDVETDLPGEYGAVMSDLDAGLTEVERSLAEVTELADQFAEVSAETASSAEEIEEASQETAGSVEEIAHGAEQQTEQLQAAAHEMNDLSATVEEVASSADGVVNTANEAAELADRGREQAADATEEIAAIESEADTAVDQVESLETRIEEINDIVGLITDIAEQTNLLALNASIEAARAGEAGEGFAVVADEIKTLADEAGDATDEVEQLIDEIQDRTDETVDDMRSMQRRVDTGADTIEGAIEMFDDIAAAVEEAEHGVEEISEAADDQAVSAEEVVAMVDEVSSVSQETAAEASTVSAATEEQTAAINDVTRNVQTVSESARELRELVEQFEVREGVAETGPGPDPDADPGTGTEPTVADGGEPPEPTRDA